MFRELWKRTTRTKTRRPVRYARPCLEPLESRTAPAGLSFENAVPLTVVDGATVSSSLQIPAQARIFDLNVSFDLTDADPGLGVSLVAPDGVTRARLFPNLGGGSGTDFKNAQISGG